MAVLRTLRRVLRWFQQRIDIFAPFDDSVVPPRSLSAFIGFYLWPVRRWLAAMLVVSLALALLESGIILATGWFVDLLAHETPATLWRDHGNALLVLAIGLLAIRPVLFFLSEALINQTVLAPVSSRILWRTHLYTLGHALPFFQRNLAGRISNHVLQIGPALREFAVELLDVVVFVCVYATVTLVAFSSISVWLAAPILVWFAAFGLLSFVFVPRMRERAAEWSTAHSVFVGRIVEAYNSIALIKLFARAENERSAIREVMETYIGKWQASLALNTAQSLAVQTINTALIVAVAGVALWLWLHGRITPGETAAGLGLVARLLSMSGWFMQLIRGMFDNLGMIRDSMQTVALPHEVVDRPRAPALAVEQGEIAFRAVSFHYVGEAFGLERLDLRIAAGESVGLVGPSGAGKSTLINLLLRFHDVQDGTIAIDGQDIAAVAQESLRRQIAVVPQEPAMLHGSVRDNIALGRAGASDAEIERAARHARAHDFIMELRDQDGRCAYECWIGERGARLSGGERQRIAIARAILKDAPIVVLDEATSALDAETEAAITIAETFRGKTLIAIAHRLSTLTALDRLVVMDQGRIVEQGSHTQLLVAGGLYARLWRTGQVGQRRTERAETISTVRTA